MAHSRNSISLVPKNSNLPVMQTGSGLLEKL